MDKPFIAIDTMDTFKTLKIASSEDNTSYIHYGTTEMPVFGTPDILWNQICFIEDTGSIYVRGRLYADFDNILSKYDELNTKINDISNKLSAFNWWIDQSEQTQG